MGRLAMYMKIVTKDFVCTSGRLLLIIFRVQVLRNSVIFEKRVVRKLLY